MKISQICLALATMLLTGCIETAEEIQARKTQFNGQTIEQVEARIGVPAHRSADTAVWVHSHSYRQSFPNYGLLNGKWVVVGYSHQHVVESCTYIASLSRGKVVSSQYEGNSCRRFAPPLSR